MRSCGSDGDDDSLPATFKIAFASPPAGQYDEYDRDAAQNTATHLRLQPANNVLSSCD
jgi:hypothetical protein